MEINKRNFERIYEQVANANQTSIEQVKTEMQSALDIAWNSNNANLRKLFPNGKPTLEEFLITMKNEVSKNATY